MTKVVNIQYKKALKRILKAALFVFLFIFTLLSSVIIALQFPSIQTLLVKKATDFASELLHYPIKINSVAINWFDIVNLNQIYVYDKEQNEMIYIEEASVDFSIASALNPTLFIDKVILKNGRVKVYKFSADSTVNITDFISAIREATAPKKSSGKAQEFSIPHVELENFFFSYYDQRKNLITKGFDYHHFSFEGINADVSNLRVIADTFQISVNSLVTTERQTQLKVKNTSLGFLVTRHNMIFDNISAEIGDSYIRDYLKFEYEDINDLSDFNEKIVVSANLDSCSIFSKDLSHFAPQLEPYTDRAILSGDFHGKVINFGVKNLDMKFGRGSQIAGRVNFKGLPEIEETYTDFKFQNLKINASDLKQYMVQGNYKFLSKFGQISGTGEFVGFPYDFVAHGKFNTNLGKLDSDLNFKILENSQPKSTYKGSLKTYGFHLGKFLDVPETVGLLDMAGKVEGRGLTISEAELKIDANISRIGVNGYDYKTIVTNAKLSDELFDGSISINDPNLIFSANGEINLKENINLFDIKGSFQKANLKPLNITDRETYLISSFNLNFTGIKPDEIVGDIFIKNTYLLYEDNKEIFIDSLFAKSTKENGTRNFYLNSDLLSCSANGNFEFSRLYTDIKKLYHEYELNLKNDKEEIARYYQAKKIDPSQKYSLNFDIRVKDLNNLFSVYVPGLYLSPNTSIVGEYSNGYTSILNFTTHFDTIFYKESELYNTDIEVSTSKFEDSANVLAMVYINSTEQSLKGYPATENFFFEGIWQNGFIDFVSRIRQKASENRINLSGQMSLERNKQKVLQLRNSSFSLLNKKWQISNGNKMYFTEKGLIFNNFNIANEEQMVELEGLVSRSSEKEAFLTFTNFQLATINQVLENIALEGTLNGKFALKNILNDLNLNGSLTVDTFKVDGFLIGNINGSSGWNSNEKRLEVNVDVTRDDQKVINLVGYIFSDKQNRTQNLNLTARLNNANLEILNPVFSGIISNVAGTATGEFNITGTTNNIIAKGKADVKKGQFKIDYLNTTYSFDDYIYLEENLIGFKKLRLKDSYGDVAVVNGGIYHDGFRNFVLNMKAYMDNFHILNTTEKDNSLFYGSAFVSGDIELLGSFNDFAIKANAVSNKGTKIYIPIKEYASVEQQSFIRFTPPKSSKSDEPEDLSNKVDLSGIKMDFNFEITPDAYAEIIFDKRAGDIIRGFGNGNLKLEIDTRGDFFIYGTYNMMKGAYNFTLANLINKEFTIKPNSSITWFGDPYQGVLNINAVYEQSASIKPLIPIASESDSLLAEKEGTRRYPVDVQLGITDNLLSPDIKLGIKINNYSGDAASYVTQFESTIQNNEQELNRQVFSLLVLGGFSAPSSFSGIAADPASNLSELLTNQLGNWLSQVDDNLQIDMDLRGLDREALNTFNLRLSYTLLDGRLRISRDGRFTNVQNADQNSFSNIAGEWTIEYLLSKDGKLRLKLYNKNTQNQLLSAEQNAANTSAGFSVLHTESFNNLQDLFSRNKNKKTGSGDDNTSDTPIIIQPKDKPKDDSIETP